MAVDRFGSGRAAHHPALWVGPRDSVRASAATLCNRYRRGFSLEREFYCSPAVFAHDLDNIWGENWIWAGHVSQVANAGDYIRFDFGLESVIVVRDRNGALRAHLNVCRHRGSRVCLEASGHTAFFSCPYHGWVYELDGSLRSARRMSDDVDLREYGLRPVQVLEFQGLVFVCLANRTQPDSAALDRLAPHVAPFALSQMKVAHTVSYPLAANWKLALENYLECYHCARAHKDYASSHSLQNPDTQTPSLNAALRARADSAGTSTQELAATGLAADPLGMDVYHRRYPLYDGYDTGSEDGQPLAPLLGRLQSFDGGASDVQIGPFNHFLIYADHVVGYRFLPRNVQETEMQVVWMVRNDALEGRDYDIRRLTWLWDRTSQDDERIIRLNQEGVNSIHYEPGPLVDMEWGIADFLDWYVEAGSSCAK